MHKILTPVAATLNTSISTLFLLSTCLVLGLSVILLSPSASAANNSTLNQSINNGTLATDIRDSSRVSVPSPSVSMSAATFSYICLTGGSAPIGTLGSNSQRVYVDNPGAANNGWTLTLAATSGPTTLWQNTGSTKNYDFNDPGSSGCTDGADTDTRGGQLTVDPSVSTITADCATCTTANITKGSPTAYSEGVTNSVTLLNAATASDDYGRWYLTGAGISQTLPAEQAVDNYTLNLTLTITAL